ncbi:MFS transporter (plasmid) [Rhizobium acidisoli]|uniref:MFS-type drug efflux transporter P55 n=1 Tax=Rhizobium acidisoli TaxID=1538158 RepID=A0AAE5WUK7_9HYPH|nr:MFS transporter [Rhizobium acidisoli]KPH07473.1 MFS transporter [Rhizobium acidisoli]QAS82796.1 MFS transporter [Rhizobium acidisoli]
MSHSSFPGGADRQAGPKQGLVIQIASSLTIMGAVMIAPMLPKLAAEFAPSSPRAAELVPLVATGPALAIALFAPAVGFLADRLGRKTMLIVGSLLYALFGFLPAVLDDLGSLLAARLAFGCAEAIIMTSCTTLIADYWTGEDRSRYVNRQVVTIGIVGSIFFVLGGAAGETNWRYPFYLYLLPLLLLPFIARTLWEPARRAEQDVREYTFSRPRILGAVTASYLLVFTGMIASFIVPVMAPGLLVALGTTSSSLIGLCTGLGLLATLVGSLAWPSARRRLGTAGVNVLLLSLLALGLWLLTSAGSYAAVMIAVAVHGLGAGFLVPNAMLPLLQTLSARYRARGVGGFTSALYLGQFASPLIILAFAQGFGGTPQGIPAAINLWAGVVLAIALIWAGIWLLHREKGRRVLPS